MSRSILVIVPTPNAGGGLDADGNVVGPYVIAVVPDPNNAGQYVPSQVNNDAGNALVDDSITLNSDGTVDPDVACGDRVVSTA